MRKEFSLSKGNVMVNFTAKYCDNHEAVISSQGFERILGAYLENIKNKNSSTFNYLCESLNTREKEEVRDSLVFVFKVLLTFRREEVISIKPEYSSLLSNKYVFIDFIEDLYQFWRKLERYTIIQNQKVNEGLEKSSFIEANTNFSNLILSLYRKIEEKVLGSAPRVYRQLPVGGNAGLILNNINWPIQEEYSKLKNIPFIQSIVLDLPFITYPKRNKRDGWFSEVFENPLEGSRINKDHWFCYPAKVGSLLAYVYFHRDFMAHGIALCNLFELAEREEYEGKKPDIVYVFGPRDDFKEPRTVFYDDVKNGIMFGYISYSDAIDYFGYMKKMTLTLHNLIMIKKGCLPIHGAMVNIKLKSGKSANVVIMGDSGAGKSETLEAFRTLGEKYISDMIVIFDDMGVLKLNGDNKPLAYGTEIGAFVRLDDLDPGYAFRELDRSIFMNPNKINARLVIPITTYKDITKGCPVDMFLYANNYEEVEGDKIELEYFKEKDIAKNVFRDGARMAKGTTTEKGLVKSYFANPFGPLQKQEETDILLEKYFSMFYSSGVKVGQLRTSLGISGKEKDGPMNAAIKLFDAINEL